MGATAGGRRGPIGNTGAPDDETREGEGPGRWEYQVRGRRRVRVWVPDETPRMDNQADPLAESRRRILASAALSTDQAFARARSGRRDFMDPAGPTMTGIPELRRRLAGGR